MRTYKENLQSAVRYLQALGYNYHIEEVANFGQPFWVVASGQYPQNWVLNTQFSESRMGTTDLGIYGPNVHVPHPDDRIPVVVTITTRDRGICHGKEIKVTFGNKIPLVTREDESSYNEFGNWVPDITIRTYRVFC